MNRWKVLLPQPIARAGMELLEKSGRFEVIVLSSPDMEKVKEVIAEVDVLLVRSGFKVHRELLEIAPRLKVISRVGAGLDNIDVAYARKKGIEVFNVEGANALSVAEHTIAFVLALAKNLFDFDRRVRKGEWDIRYAYRTFEIQGKTLVGVSIDDKFRVFVPKSLFHPPASFCRRSITVDEADTHPFKLENILFRQFLFYLPGIHVTPYRFERSKSLQPFEHPPLGKIPGMDNQRDVFQLLVKLLGKILRPLGKVCVGKNQHLHGQNSPVCLE